MRAGWGLQAKMTASYVLVTAAAVALVEAVLLVVVVPGLVSRADAATLVERTAQDYAGRAMVLSAGSDRLPTADELQLGERGLELRAGEGLAAEDRETVRIPYQTTARDDARPVSLALLLAPDGRIVASSYPARYKVGARIGDPGVGPLPAAVLATGSLAWTKGTASAVSPTANGDALWAMTPVLRAGPLAKTTGKPGVEKSLQNGKVPAPVEADGAPDDVGAVYVQVPADAKLVGRWASLRTLLPQLWIGLLVLAAAIPVGLVFGLLSTRRPIGRLRRLASSTVAVAAGDFHHRLPESGSDEIAQLERNFNRMAERLDAAMATQRRLAGAGERARIARELHDAISQDLFSLHMLAGGLRRALPADSPLQAQVSTMERTANGTMQEMQALLLELRPIALEDAGLVAALEELCQAYRERLGVTVDAELSPVELSPPVEHAALRVVQEALANAVRHARPSRVVLRLRQEDGRVAVTVSDDGEGFDVAGAGARHGLGLGLMRERVAELGGELRIDSTPGQGTSVRILLPRGWP
jgi:signal transduction histidine kinase